MHRQISSAVLKSSASEERRLRSELPSIFAFLDSIGTVREVLVYGELFAELNHLPEIERRVRGTKCPELKDIGAMKALSYGKLSGNQTQSACLTRPILSKFDILIF